MRGFLCLSQVLFFFTLVIMALLQPHHRGAAVDSWARSQPQSQMNISAYGCVGLHCLADDEMEGNLFTEEEHHVSRMLVKYAQLIVPSTANPHKPAVDCKIVNGLYTSCLGTPTRSGRPCVPSNREYPYCG